jgi:hypothetical protein
MPTQIGTSQSYSRRQGTESSNRADYGIASIWLVFYVLALGVAISSPLISRVIEIAALTAE